MADGGGDQFAKHAAAVGRELYGDPNKQLSSKDELRFGRNGSVSLDLTKGTFYDHEQKEGGGVLWAIQAVTGASIEGGHAVEWMRQHGFDIEDREAPPSDSYSGHTAGDRAGPRLDPQGNYLPERVPDNGRLTAIYDYQDAEGRLAYQVCRYDWPDPENPKGHAKTFVQRRPDASKKHGFAYSVKGLELLPYRLPELMEDIASGYEIFVVEGEKAADRLRAEGVPATCNTGGAGKPLAGIAKWFRGARVTIIGDNDPQAMSKDGDLKFHESGEPVLPGQDHARAWGNELLGIAGQVKVIPALPDVPLKGDVVDYLDAGHTVDDLYSLASRTPIFTGSIYHSKFRAVTWQEMDAPGPEHEWLIKHVLTRAEVSMLAGASQSGKTFLALDKAMAVARGVPWFGKKTLHGGVVYCAAESARGVRRKRLKAYRQHYGIEAENIPFVLLQSPLDLYSNDDHTQALIDEIKHWSKTFPVPLELVVIDTLAAVTPGWDENSGKDVSPVLARCGRIRDATGAHVMLVHHLNADGTKARGHTSITANIENVMLVKKVDNAHDADGRILREATITKQKEEEDGAKFRFVLPAIEIGRDADGDKITSCIVAPPSGTAGQALPDNGVIIQGNAATVLKAIYDAVEKSGVLAPPELGLPFGSLVVDRQAVSKRLAEIAFRDEGEAITDDDKRKRADNRRQMIVRARELLYTRGIIGISDPWIWLTGKRVRGFAAPPGAPVRRDQRRAEQEAAEAAREEEARANVAGLFDDDDDPRPF